MTVLNRNLLLGLGALLLVGLLVYFREIVLYILLAWVLSLLGAPLMRFFQKYIRIGKWSIGGDGAAVLTLTTFSAILVLFLLLFVPPVVKQASALANIDYHQLELQLAKPFGDLDAKLHEIGILTSAESLGGKLKDAFQKWFDPMQLGKYATGAISAAGNVMVLLTVVSFILFFFLRDHELFDEMVKSLTPPKYDGKVLHAVHESSQMLTRYFLGLMIQAFSFAMIVSLILLALGIPNAFLIGFFGGIMNLVPYVGPLVGSAFGIFITLSAQLHLPFEQIWPDLVKVAAAFAVTQVIDNFLLQPYISSKSVKAHPLEIFLVTLAGAQVGGLLGMVIAIPVYTVLRVIAKVFFSEFRLVQNLTGEEHPGEKT
jgi:predicted PurR-regulated permease PerM